MTTVSDQAITDLPEKPGKLLIGRAVLPIPQGTNYTVPLDYINNNVYICTLK